MPFPVTMPKPARRTLIECCPQQPGTLAVDGPSGLVKGVKLLGLTSKNRRRYEEAAVREALGLYEGIPVNLDHPDPKNPSAPRSVKERFARAVNVRAEPDGLYGDLRYNPKHAFAPAFEWFAANDPAAIGMSHNAVCEVKEEAGTLVVKKIVELRSVDVVADAATTNGLFEAIMDPELDAGAGDEGGGDEGYEAHLGHLIVSLMNDPELDLKAKRKKILKALKLLDDGEAGGEGETDTEEGGDEGRDLENGKPREQDDEEEECDMEPGKKKAEESVALYRKHKDPAVRRLAEQFDRLQASVKLRERKDHVRKLCEAAKLPKPAVTELFLEQLVNAADDKAAKALIEDRRQLAGVRTPVSASPRAGGQRMDVKEFARQLRGA